ncbi:MAG: hypothetical protein ACLP5H_23280 [Desulfomonilaceae bacterium]
MEGSDKARILSRLQELVATHGKHWGIITEIMEKEGFRDKGKPLTTEALRKRYKKLSGTEQPSEASEPDAVKEPLRDDFEEFNKRRMDSSLKQFEEAESAAADSPGDGIASLVTLINRLLEHVRVSNGLMKRLEKRIEQQEQKTIHADVDAEPPVTSRDLLELLKEITSRREQQMQFIEEQKRNYVEREEVQQLLEELIPDRVDAELRTMLDGEPVRNLISGILDDRLKGYMQDITVKEAHRGPGRGKVGRTHKKFSASLPEDLFEEVKSLPGMFSAHLDASLRLYLKILKGGEQ